MIHQIRITTAPGVFIKNSVPRVMAHYGFTTEDIGSHPNALMSVKKFAHTSIRPYVGECVFDSLVNPISPIYCAIRKMCREQATKIPAELSAADKAAKAPRLGGLALPADDRECLLFKLQRLMRNDEDDTDETDDAELQKAEAADARERLQVKLQRLLRNDDDIKIPARTSVMTYGKNGFGARTHLRWQ